MDVGEWLNSLGDPTLAWEAQCRSAGYDTVQQLLAAKLTGGQVCHSTRGWRTLPLQPVSQPPHADRHPGVSQLKEIGLTQMRQRKLVFNALQKNVVIQAGAAAPPPLAAPAESATASPATAAPAAVASSTHEPARAHDPARVAAPKAAPKTRAAPKAAPKAAPPPKKPKPPPPPPAAPKPASTGVAGGRTSSREKPS